MKTGPLDERDPLFFLSDCLRSKEAAPHAVHGSHEVPRRLAECIDSSEQLSNLPVHGVGMPDDQPAGDGLCVDSAGFGG